MPAYPWFFEEDGLTPNKVGLSIIAYVQWLGSWQETVQETVHDTRALEAAFPAPDLDLPLPPAEEAPGETAPDESDFWGDDDAAGDAAGEARGRLLGQE